MKNKTYSTQHALYLKKIKRDKIFINCTRVAVLLIFLCVWELCASLELIDPFVTSSPLRIVKTIGELITAGTLFYHIGITLAETIIGFFIAVILGYGIAVLLWFSNTLQKILEPYIVVLNSLPKIALGPLLIIWIGTGYEAIVFMTVLVSIIVCIMNTLAGFNSVDQNMLTLMKSMGAKKTAILLKLLIPASLPALMNTLKVAVGLAWIGSIMGEYIVSRAGLGYLIVYGGQVFKLDLVMTATFILCVLAGGMYAIIALLEKKFTKLY